MVSPIALSYFLTTGCNLTSFPYHFPWNPVGVVGRSLVARTESLGPACPSHWPRAHWGGREVRERVRKWEEEGVEWRTGRKESAE